jgi:hypothetical protein
MAPVKHASEINANAFACRVKVFLACGGQQQKNPRSRRGFMAINPENRYGMLAV